LGGIEMRMKVTG